MADTMFLVTDGNVGAVGTPMLMLTGENFVDSENLVEFSRICSICLLNAEWLIR